MPVFSKGDFHALFIHVPKTGGSSIENLFETAGYDVSFLRREPLNVRAKINHLRRCSPQHMHAELLDQTFRLRAFDVVFMFVREPIDRFRSEYAFNSRKSFDPSSAAVDRWANEKFRNYRENPFAADNHLRPQSEFYVPGAEVFRYEDGLEAGLRDLNDRYELGLPTAVPHENSSTRESVGSSSAAVEISAGLERRLRTLYASDFAQFGY
ncbi:sulfotransferase family 2 domain-containing protein [Brevibacterium litoralis]|uniref:sulfotransferase family 2 domain-containing protein n=1 Tax=Brevibacterium litoralis TaxID=3138935 RepID=UPI0032ED5B9A